MMNRNLNKILLCAPVVILIGMGKKPQPEVLEKNDLDSANQTVNEVEVKTFSDLFKKKYLEFKNQNTALDKTLTQFKKLEVHDLRQSAELKSPSEKNGPASKNINVEVVESKNQIKREVLEAINQWNPDDNMLKIYKRFFHAQSQDDFSELFKLYSELKLEKKYLKLRLEILKSMLKISQLQPALPQTQAFLLRESKLILKQVRGISDGEILESAYLKWLFQNNLKNEICRGERGRWITETEIDFVQLNAGLESCPLKYEDFITRLRRLIFAAKDFQALREIESFAELNKIAPWEKAYLMAIYDSNVGDPAKAFVDVQKFENELLQSDFSENYFYIAQRAGELRKAEVIINKIIERPVKKSDLKDLKFQKAFLFYQTKRYKEAFQIFNDLFLKSSERKARRKSKDFEQLAWLRGWMMYLDGQYEKAAELLHETKPYTRDEARLMYWLAKIKLQQSQEVDALSEFKKLAQPIIDNRAFSFYNLLGWIQYENLKKKYQTHDAIKNILLLTKMSKGFYPQPDDNLTRAQLMNYYNMLDDTSFTTDEGDIQVINNENEVIQNADTLDGIEIHSQNELIKHLVWAQYLIDHEQKDLARSHLLELEKKIKDRRTAIALAQFYLDHDFYYRALSLTQRFSPSNATLSLKSESLVWSSLFPEAYKNDVFKMAEAKKVDPYLIYSIMRAETQFKADAISPVGALGLMQFMPYSAKKVADLLEESIDFSELFRPEKSIEFGATYLKKLSLEFDYQKPLIAAAYNGGPHRVKAWLRQLGTPQLDLFVEHIPFAETRTYVKRVMTFRATYDKLYNNRIDLDKYNYLTEPIKFDLQGPISFKEEWDPYKAEIKKLKN